LEKIGREGDEEGRVRKRHIESDRGREAAFGESQKGEKGSGRIWSDLRKTEEVEKKKEDHAEVFLKDISRIEGVEIHGLRADDQRSSQVSKDEGVYEVQEDVKEIQSVYEVQRDVKETSATESDNSEPHLVKTLIKTFQGMQHTLQALTQGFKEMIRNKTWARKAHSRRERRRAARQKEVGYQSLLPADCPQETHTIEDYGSKTEAGSQPPTEDWAPPTEPNQAEKEDVKKLEADETKDEREVYEAREDDKELKVYEKKDTKHRDMMRMYRKARSWPTRSGENGGSRRNQRRKQSGFTERTSRWKIRLVSTTSSTESDEEKNFRRT
jgi:hypothetical protein